MAILAADEIFTADFQSRVTPGILAAINSSPTILAMIAEAKLHPRMVRIDVGISLGGWFFDANENPRRIVVDPIDFVNYATNPGGFVLGLAHELGHAVNPAGTPSLVGLTDPLA